MKILLLDDEELSLYGLSKAVARVRPDADLYEFRDAQEALKCMEIRKPDIVFLDIELRLANGVDVARKMKQKNPRVNIIFVTGYNEYMGEAFSLHASGYILKPVTADKVRQELENLRCPVTETRTVRPFIRTFGEFEIFVHDVPLPFAYAKTKELLAILVNENGAMCSVGRIMKILWQEDAENDKHRSYLSNLFSDLQHVLRQQGCGDVLLKRRGQAGINKTKVDCDLYDFLNGKADAVRRFHGVYMSQYAWASATLPLLAGQL